MANDQYEGLKCAGCMHRNGSLYSHVTEVSGSLKAPDGPERWCGVFEDSPEDTDCCQNYAVEDITDGVRKLLEVKPNMITLELTGDGVPYLLASTEEGKQFMLLAGSNDVVPVEK